MRIRKRGKIGFPLFLYFFRREVFMVIATISDSFPYELIDEILQHPLVDAVRFNTGAPSPNTAYETLSQLKASTLKPIWIDLKCRQLRVIQWCAPYYSEIELNHEIEVELPAQIYFRGQGWLDIRAVKKNKIYLIHPPEEAIGKGQSVNISAKFLQIKGYFTEKDIEYIKAAELLDINYFMLSFYEEEEDLVMFKSQLKHPENAYIGLKIESLKGIEAIQELKELMDASNAFLHEQKLTLVVARDDLLVNLRDEPTKIISVLEQCIKFDKYAIAASQFFSGLKHKGICASDISDIHLIHSMGYGNFLLSDEICLRHFSKAMSIWQQYKDMKGVK